MEMMQKLCKIAPDYLVDDTDDRVIIISRYDDSGNWAAFICKRVTGKIHCGGHMGLGRSMTDLLEWMDEMRIRGIEMIVNMDWFLKS